MMALADAYAWITPKELECPMKRGPCNVDSLICEQGGCWSRPKTRVCNKTGLPLDGESKPGDNGQVGEGVPSMMVLDCLRWAF